jgi:hypothetical protein
MSFRDVEDLLAERGFVRQNMLEAGGSVRANRLETGKAIP